MTSNNIKIINTDGRAQGTIVTTPEGTLIEGVTSIDLRFRANSLVEATIGVSGAIVDVEAHPLLTLDSLQEAALFYGYKLVKD